MQITFRADQSNPLLSDAQFSDKQLSVSSTIPIGEDFWLAAISTEVTSALSNRKPGSASPYLQSYKIKLAC